MVTNQVVYEQVYDHIMQSSFPDDIQFMFTEDRVVMLRVHSEQLSVIYFDEETMEKLKVEMAKHGAYYAPNTCKTKTEFDMHRSRSNANR